MWKIKKKWLKLDFYVFMAKLVETCVTLNLTYRIYLFFLE